MGAVVAREHILDGVCPEDRQLPDELLVGFDIPRIVCIGGVAIPELMAPQRVVGYAGNVDRTRQGKASRSPLQTS